MGVAKVTLNGSTLMDTTGMTVTSNTMVSATTALDKAGNVVTGNLTARSSADLDVDGSVVTVPPGVYAASASVDVFGGGGSSTGCGATSNTLTSAASSISFTGLNGEPSTFVIIAKDTLATGAAPYKVAAIVFDGTSLHGQTITNTNNAQVTYDSSSFSKSYSNGTLTVTSTGPYFQAVQYQLIYTYGTAPLITTKDVQVGSGATSVTFTDLPTDNALYFSCIFKSNFGTSSGYQRVIWVVSYDGVMGMEMDSSAKFAEHWTVTKNGTSLTITSNGTNQGGYFHQPGYYQLTYVVAQGGGSGSKLQDKNVTPTESQQVVSADNSYLALSTVTVAGISSNYVGTNVPRKSSSDLTVSGSVVSGPMGYYSQAFSRAIDVTSGIGATISYLSAYNTIRATGVVSSAGYATTGNKGTYDIEPDSLLPVKVAATYTPTTTNQTIASQRWLTGTQTILGDANLVASNIASGVSIFGVTGTHQGGGDLTHTITLMNSGKSSGTEIYGIEYKNSLYFDQGTIINYTPGDTIRFFMSGQYSYSNREIFLNNQLVAGLSDRVYNNSYIYTLTSQPLYVHFNSENKGIYAYEGNVNDLFVINYSLATRQTLSATFEGVSTWANTLYYTYESQFTQQPFNGSFTFNNLRYVNAHTFQSTDRAGYSGSFSATFPNISLIFNAAFMNNSNIKYINASNCLTIGQSAFGSCPYLTEVIAPNCTMLSYGAFQSCSKLSSIVAPNISTIGGAAFYGCYSLISLVFSSVTGVGANAFQTCINLQYISLPICQSISNEAFSNCRQLISLYLNSVSVVTTLGSRVFNSTPIGGYSASAGQYGSVFVPASLYNSFITATNWVSISSRIVSV